ncbi:hypothetical protein [Campylobacter curvus]|jgi:hypothetical protein|uniref:hypothetical protein n=1 Tax=Campylobacter curvus TaxID=200 RepID=UPI00147035EC|nr:hypothetical protein [Campylobacter curvus]
MSKGALKAIGAAVATTMNAVANVVQTGSDSLLDATTALKTEAAKMRIEAEKTFQDDIEKDYGGIEQVIARSNEVNLMLDQLHGRA